MTYQDFVKQVHDFAESKGDYDIVDLLPRVIFTTAIESMATNGRNIFVNPVWTSTLTVPQIVGVLTHELLHEAFGHTSAPWSVYDRNSGLSPNEWHHLANVAEDIVINDLVRDTLNEELPQEGTFREDYDLPETATTSHEIFTILKDAYRQKKEEVIDAIRQALQKSAQREQDDEKVKDIPEQTPDKNDGSSSAMPMEIDLSELPELQKEQNQQQQAEGDMSQSADSSSDGEQSSSQSSSGQDSSSSQDDKGSQDSSDSSKSSEKGSEDDSQSEGSSAKSQEEQELADLRKQTEEAQKEADAATDKVKQLEEKQKELEDESAKQDGSSDDVSTSDKDDDAEGTDGSQQAQDDTDQTSSGGSQSDKEKEELEKELEEARKAQQEAQDKLKELAQEMADKEQELADSEKSDTESGDGSSDDAEGDGGDSSDSDADSEEDSDSDEGGIDSDKGEADSESKSSSDNDESSQADAEDASDAQDNSSDDLSDEDSDTSDEDGGDDAGSSTDTDNPIAGNADGSSEIAKPTEDEGDSTKFREEKPRSLDEVVRSMAEKVGPVLKEKLTQTKKAVSAPFSFTPPNKSWIDRVMSFAAGVIQSYERSRTYTRPGRRPPMSLPGSTPTPIKGYRSGDPLPRAQFYIDCSGSMGSKPELIRRELAKRKTLLGRTQSTVVPFDHRLGEPIDITMELPHMGGGTSINKVIQDINNTDGVNVFAVITDAGDTFSTDSIDKDKNVVFVTDTPELVMGRPRPNIKVIGVDSF